MEDKMKKICFALIKLLALPLIFVACASNKLEGSKGSDFHFSECDKILIFGNFNNYKKNNALYRDMLESEVKNQFSLNGIKAYKSSEVPDFFDFKGDNFESGKFLNDNDVDLLLNIRIPSCGASFDKKRVEMKTKFDITAFDAKTDEILFECSAKIKEKGDDLTDCMRNTFKSLSKKMAGI